MCTAHKTTIIANGTIAVKPRAFSGIFSRSLSIHVIQGPWFTTDQTFGKLATLNAGLVNGRLRLVVLAAPFLLFRVTKLVQNEVLTAAGVT